MFRRRRPEPTVALTEVEFRIDIPESWPPDGSVKVFADLFADVMFGGWDRQAPKGWDLLMSAQVAGEGRHITFEIIGPD